MHTNLKAKVYVLTFCDYDGPEDGGPSIRLMSLERWCIDHGVKPDDYEDDPFDRWDDEPVVEWFENHEDFHTVEIDEFIDFIDVLTRKRCILKDERLNLFRSLLGQLANWRD